MVRDKISDDVPDRRLTLLEDRETGLPGSELDDGPAVCRKRGSARSDADDPRRARMSSSEYVGDVLLDLWIPIVINDDNGRSGSLGHLPRGGDDLRATVTARPVPRRVANPL